MRIEGRREARKQRVSRVKPVRPRKAGPFALRDDVCLGKFAFETVGYDAKESRQYGRDSQLTQASDDPLCSVRPSFQQFAADRAVVAAQISHDLPILMGRKCDPGAQLA